MKGEQQRALKFTDRERALRHHLRIPGPENYFHDMLLTF